MGERIAGWGEHLGGRFSVPKTQVAKPSDAHVLTLVGNLVKMLRNDMRSVIECRCKVHGTAGDGLNFTACLVCLVACDVVGVLSATTGQSDRDASTAFLGRVGGLARDHRYEKCARALFAFFRDGIAHGFLPKQVTSSKGASVTGVVVWYQLPGRISPCIDWFRDEKAGRGRLRELRRNHHLRLRRVSGNGTRAFEVAPHVLYWDIDLALDQFQHDLERDAALANVVIRNFRRLEARSNADALKRLDAINWAYLQRGK